jgi:hypothetical protein
MKITREGLKSLIAEELRPRRTALLEHDAVPQLGPDSPKDESDQGAIGGSTAKQQLFHLARKADQLHDMLPDTEELPGWAKDPVAAAVDHIHHVFEKMMWEKHNPGDQ